MNISFEDFNKKTECTCSLESFERTCKALEEYSLAHHKLVKELSDIDLKHISDELGYCLRFVITVSDYMIKSRGE